MIQHKAMMLGLFAASILTAPAFAQVSTSNSGSTSGSNSAANSNPVVSPTISPTTTSTSGSDSTSASNSSSQSNPVVTTTIGASGVGTSQSGSQSGANSGSVSGSTAMSGTGGAGGAGGSGGAGGTGGEATANSSANTGASTATNDGNSQSTNSQTNVNMTSNSYSPAKQTLRTAPATVAPALTTTLSETCMGSSSGGLSLVGVGVTAGSTWRDSECVRRLNARELAQTIGDREAAREVLCGNPEVFRAYEAVGRPCALHPDGTPNASYIREEAANYAPSRPLAIIEQSPAEIRPPPTGTMSAIPNP